MQHKDLIIFSASATIVLIVFWSLLANTQILIENYRPEYVIGFVLQNAFVGFIGFLLVGFGLKLMFKSEKLEL